jgi:hypothetical protein
MLASAPRCTPGNWLTSASEFEQERDRRPDQADKCPADITPSCGSRDPADDERMAPARLFVTVDRRFTPFLENSEADMENIYYI